MNPSVRMCGIVKRFEDTLALDGVDFELCQGEIHALLGENGAGKSTLMHVLAGIYSPDAGTIEVDGRPVRLRSARDASHAGIGMVHQHFTLVENFTVGENLALALPEQTPFLLPREGLGDRALRMAEQLGWKLDAHAPVWQLPVGTQQRIEIVKVLAQEPRIMIFDEPTAVLAPVELEELFVMLERLRDEGKSIVFISHKLNEVLRLCDRVTVLRRGQNAGTVEAKETDAAALASRMVGRADPEEIAEALPAAPHPSAAAPGEVMLHVRELHVRGDYGLDAVRGLSLEIRGGEILGIAGVDGNGQTELAESILGLRRVREGAVELAAGEGSGPAGRRREIGYVPQDRRRMGLAQGMSVRDNLILELHQEPEACWGPWLNWPYLNTEAGGMMEAYDVRASSLEQPVETLSGGNQQKIVLARALHKQPRLLVALNPTRGLDVGATAYVHGQLRLQRERGAAILLISTELDEVIELSDRIGVLYEGRLMGVVSPLTPRESLGMMMGGRQPGPDAHLA
jgi:general nucleoside transport system ATP-binding protein